MRVVGRLDWVHVVERAYSLDGDDASWLRGVLGAARPRLDAGHGVLGYVYDASDPRRPALATADGMAPALAELLPVVLAFVQQREIARFYAADRPFAALHELIGGPEVLARSEYYGGRSVTEGARSTWVATRLGDRPWSHPRDIVDCVRALGVSPGGPGIVLAAPRSSQSSTPHEEARAWSRAMVHVAAALRLRRRLGEMAASHLAEGGDAVVRLDGRVEHATNDARAPEARDALREAAVRIDRARGSLRNEGDDEALASWEGLVDGRWSLVDRFDRDGRHYLVALENTPAPRGPRALTPAERAVVGYATLGWSNKEIAYALGLGVGTVGTHLGRAMARLGARNRVELSRFAAELSDAGARRSWIRVGLERIAVVSLGSLGVRALLSRAEEQIAALASRGLSNDDIARERGTASRTVANQLHSIYRKLGLSSRSELVRRLVGIDAGEATREATD
jgi:DNA-binding NarL/FixJ family response regulator